ncbi:hypothetical protein GCM10022206_13770 [Streptomyces chiangmaiensis]
MAGKAVDQPNIHGISSDEQARHIRANMRCFGHCLADVVRVQRACARMEQCPECDIAVAPAQTPGRVEASGKLRIGCGFCRPG